MNTKLLKRFFLRLYSEVEKFRGQKKQPKRNPPQSVFRRNNWSWQPWALWDWPECSVLFEWDRGSRSIRSYPGNLLFHAEWKIFDGMLDTWHTLPWLQRPYGTVTKPARVGVNGVKPRAAMLQSLVKSWSVPRLDVLTLGERAISHLNSLYWSHTWKHTVKFVLCI